MADPVPTTVAVNVQSAAASKINWANIISAVAMILSYLTGGKVGLTPEQQAALAVTIGLISNLVTVILKTFFTKTVTPSSVANATTSTTSTTAVKIT